MPFIGITSVTGSGDVGGSMLNRLHWRKTDGSLPIPADVQVAYDAAWDFWSGVAPNLPGNITWEVNFTATLIDEASGILQQYMNGTTPKGSVSGLGPMGHAAGIGGRVHLRTTTVSTKRLMRGAIFVVPLSSASFQNDGTVTPAAMQTLNGAAGSWVAALAGGGLQGVVYHRPPKGTTAGGKSALISAYDTPASPAGLRSRRS